LGINRVSIQENDGEPLAYFDHSGIDWEWPLFFESHGTRNFVAIFPRLAFALGSGGTAIMDEIDSDIHPTLMPEIVNWFYEEHNTRNAQLMMTCHNASLLHNLWKEEVWLVEKASDGSTTTYPLRAVRGIRRDANLYAKYISGAFGGIPRIG
jgi:AAA15 family ATPase/GTPase